MNNAAHVPTDPTIRIMHCVLGSVTTASEFSSCMVTSGSGTRQRMALSHTIQGRDRFNKIKTGFSDPTGQVSLKSTPHPHPV
jgi:hypothetical protein